MATAAPTAARPEKAEPRGPAVIRQVKGGGETTSERLLRKQVPAWVASGVVHVLLVAVLIGLSLFQTPTAAKPSDDQLTIVAADKAADEKQPDLTNPDLGVDPDIPAVAKNDNQQDVNVDTKVTPTETPGIEESKEVAKLDILPPPGVGDPNPLNPGVAGTEGTNLAGAGSGGSGVMANQGFQGRGQATRNKLLTEGGGNSRSEAAVALGLIWLAKQQKANGSWIYDGAERTDAVGATGMSLLPFLAAGQTHRYSKDNKYNKNVEAGLKYLIASQNRDGSFRGASQFYMYDHGIATVALCEALGMTGDREFLRPAAQAAVNYILRGQGFDGSWGYAAGTTGDTSIVGWQVQALQSAKMCKELVIDKKSFDRASKFLNTVASGSNKSQYGYRTPGPTPTLTSVGLLCRYYADGWGPNNPGMAGGVAYLMKTHTPDKNKMDMYYYYYATQILHFFEGPDWHKEWNPKMRDLLIDSQVPRGKGANEGSWDPAGDPWIGLHCGRLGMTAVSLLTLEVYYRHLPLYKRGTGGLQELERAK